MSNNGSGAEAGIEPGEVGVMATKDRGHSPAELAVLCASRIISVAATAPQPIRDQALAFQERLVAILVHYMQQAATSERTTLAAKLRKLGYADLADNIHRL